MLETVPTLPQSVPFLPDRRDRIPSAATRPARFDFQFAASHASTAAVAFEAQQSQARRPAMAWRIEGQYMETCNCTFVCPCIGSNLTAQPTEGDCKAAIALKVEKGDKDGVALDGLAFIVLLFSP
jgi:hypothetical protein